jgi:hypothetical protein
VYYIKVDIADRKVNSSPTWAILCDTGEGNNEKVKMADLDSGLLENIGMNWIDLAAKYGCTHSTRKTN